jgi:hypothetical protein
VLAAPFAAIMACSTTATITERDTTRYEVAIVRSTPSELIVATRNGERPIARDQISDIDHPGNVAIVVGSALLAAGALNLAGLYSCQDSRRSDFCAGWAGGGALALSGLGLVVWGAVVWTQSVHAARDEQAAPVARLAPAIFAASGRSNLGATLALSF